MHLSDTVLEQPDVYGWDWSATTHDAVGAGATVADVVADMTTALCSVDASGHVVTGGKGLQGWAESLDVFDSDGYRLGRVYSGGGRTDVHVVSTSDAAERVRGHTTAVYGCKTARVDTRVDTLVPFELLAAILEEAAEGYGSQIVEMTGRAGHRGDRHETGRTVYLGAPSSAIRVRLYEKWLESPGQYVEGTNRVEVQLRPPTKAKAWVSAWSRAETFCASRVTRDLAERLGADLAPPASLHVSRGTPDLERSLEAMGEQYGKACARWLKVSQGDVSRLLHYLTVKV